MNTFTEIIRAYTDGTKTLEETNAALHSAGSDLVLSIRKNELTEAELAAVSMGGTAAEVNGWGLLDTGTGSTDKVEIVHGRLVNCDCGGMDALVVIGGKTYHVQGNTLVD